MWTKLNLLDGNLRLVSVKGLKKLTNGTKKMKKTLKEILEECHLNIFDQVNLNIDPNYGTDKGEPKSYIDEYYEENFKKYREKDITLVEIGVRSGASLKLWSEYFCEKSRIYGLDNLYDKDTHSVPINEDWISSKNVEYIVGDAYTEEVCGKLPNIDILIDDGPHTFESHVKLLQLYVPKINTGGSMRALQSDFTGRARTGFLPIFC